MARYMRYASEASSGQVQWGSCADPRGLLVVGHVYEVEREDVHTMHTKIFLKGFPGKGFNSVNFEESINEAAQWNS